MKLILRSIKKGDSDPIEFDLAHDQRSLPLSKIMIKEDSLYHFWFYCGDHKVGNVRLVVSDVEYKLSYNSYRDMYEILPINHYGGDAFLFSNYCGLAQLKVIYTNHEGDQVLFSPLFEVLAKKINADNLGLMFDYIINQSDSDIFNLMSATSRFAHLDRGKDPRFIVDKLNRYVDVLENNIKLISNKPISKVTTKRKILMPNENLELNDSSISWILENISEAEEIDNIENAVFIYDEKPYSLHEIEASVNIDNIDIYENQVIHGAVHDLIVYLRDLKRKISKKKNNKVFDDGYVSFYSIMNKMSDVMVGITHAEVNRLIARLKMLLKLLNLRVPVKSVINQPPKLTLKAKSSKPYLNIYIAIHHWIKNNKINWAKYELLISIENIPKVYEIYNLLRIKKFLSSSFEKNVDAHGAIYWTSGESTFKLLYEPCYWLPNHTNGSGDLIISFQRKWTNSFNGHIPARHTGDYQCRTPDFVIEVITSGDKRLIVLDAKYSSMDTTYNISLQSMMWKYLNNIIHTDGRQVVDSLVLLTPHEDIAYADYYHAPYGLYNNKPVRPYVGVQGAPIISNNDCGERYSLSNTLKLIIENIKDSYKEFPQNNILNPVSAVVVN